VQRQVVRIEHALQPAIFLPGFEHVAERLVAVKAEARDILDGLLGIGRFEPPGDARVPGLEPSLGERRERAPRDDRRSGAERESARERATSDDRKLMHHRPLTSAIRIAHRDAVGVRSGSANTT
jgi:hypothetical protein